MGKKSTSSSTTDKDKETVLPIDNLIFSEL